MLAEALLFPACPSVRISSVYSTVVVITLTYSFLIGFLLNSSIKLLFKFEYGFYPTNDNQDGRQHDCRLSVSIVVVTLTQSFLIGILPEFIYGLLPSNSYSSLNTCFVRRTLIKMAYKMAAIYQFALVDLSHLTTDGFQIPYRDYF